jgi:MFS transporter, DHA1 family, inner membrane transport protein
MASLTRHAPGSRVERWLALFCAAVVVAWVIQRLVPNQEDAIEAFAAPDWLPLAAAGFAAAGIMSLDRSALWLRARRALRWTGLLLMVWAASGLPFDLLTAAGLMGHRTAAGEIVLSTVYWPALVTRAFALAAVVALARLTLAHPVASTFTRAPAWLGYVAFVLALPYPVLRVHWALGGTLGLTSPGGAGVGWEPLLIAIPWVLAAVLSLLLASPPHWMPRRLLLAAGWSATATVAMIGPAAFWAFVGALASGGDMATGEIALWVFGLFYGSWFLWAIAGGAATRAYQLRSAPLGMPSPA